MRPLILCDWTAIPEGMLGAGGRQPSLLAMRSASFTSHDGPDGIAVCEIDTAAVEQVRHDERFALVDDSVRLAQWLNARGHSLEAALSAVERVRNLSPQPVPVASAPQNIPPDAFPCMYRGELLRTDTCNLCGVKGLPFDVYRCSLPQIGECSISKRHSKVKSCIGCESREEPQVTAAISVPTPESQESPAIEANQVTAPVAAILSPPSGLQLVTDHKRRPAGGWENRFRGSHAFLICGGPSLLSLDLSLLNQRGVLTAAVNNAAAVHRPHLWFSADTPAHFSPQILHDPAVAKFFLLKRAKKPTRRLRGKVWIKTNEKAATLPNTFFYLQSDEFNPNTFLTDSKVSWGSQQNVGRCVMLCAIRLLYWMGVRTLYLVGADFKMEPAKPYAFDEKQHPKLCEFNNRKYALINDQLTQAAPHFAEYGYRVFNCNHESGLTAFPFLDYTAAIQQAREASDNANPPLTRGLYGK